MQEQEVLDKEKGSLVESFGSKFLDHKSSWSVNSLIIQLERLKQRHAVNIAPWLSVITQQVYAINIHTR